MSRRKRIGLAMMGVFHLVALACAPDLASQYPGVRNQTIAWQCPTPSPVPTVRIGWDEWTETDAQGTEVPHREPIYSTPVPTATPYVRTGSTYYAGHRVQVGPLVLSAKRDNVDVMVTVENTASKPVELHFFRSQVRTALVNGRKAEGSWTPKEDGPGLYAPKSKTTVRLTFPDLHGTPHTWGMPFSAGEQRTGSSGSQQVWWILDSDPHGCNKPGGPPQAAYNGEYGDSPAFGRGGWPVPPNTAISRGYGCHPYWTDKPGGPYGCPSSAPWWHDGADFACSGCPAMAPKAAHVVFAGSTGDCAGNWVMLRDADGYTYSYYHLNRWLVNGGTQVEAGQPIGVVGTTGCSTGDHLHFSVKGPDGRERNPFDVLEQHAAGVSQ